MKRILFLAAAAACAMSAAAAGPGLATSVTGVQARQQQATSTASVLHDQSDPPFIYAIVSQNFEAAYDSYDSQGADDFVVPSGQCWKITEVDVTGTYFNGPGPTQSMRVIIYNDKDGTPHEKKIVSDQNGIVPTTDDNGKFVITLPDAVKAKPGKYWISVLANMDLDVDGQWAWQTRDGALGTPSRWKNSGGGLRPECRKYGDMATCVGNLGDGALDYLFALKGKSKAC